MLRPGLPPDLINQAIGALKEYEAAIMKAGEATQTDYKANVHYVNIIFEIEHLIQDLKNANSN
tara:strand:- start:273 stop:461 length:189 start_codon:yes stop_codon:yes gene_type:complete